MIDKGIDNLVFGMTIEEIVGVIGQPDKINTEELSDFMVYYYNNLFVKLYYYAKPRYTLKSIETYNKKTELFGHRIIGQPKYEVIKLLNSNNISSDELVLYDYGRFDTIFVDSFYMTFNFMFDKLVSVLFSSFH